MKCSLLISMVLFGWSTASAWAGDANSRAPANSRPRAVLQANVIQKQRVVAERAAPEKMIRLDVLIATVAFDSRGKLSLHYAAEGKNRPAAEPRGLEAGTVAAMLAAELNDPKGTKDSEPARAVTSLLVAEFGKTDAIESVVNAQIVIGSSGQPGFVKFGYAIPRITGTSQSKLGTINQITMENVGTIIAATGRVANDGKIVLDLDIEHSELGRNEDGTVVFKSETSEARSPMTQTLTLQTTLATKNGQAVVVSDQVGKWPNKVCETFVIVIPQLLETRK